MGDDFAKSLPVLDSAAYYSPPSSPRELPEYSFMSNRGNKLAATRATRRGRLGTQLAAADEDDDGDDAIAGTDGRKSKKRKTFDIAPNFALVHEDESSAEQPARAVLPPAPQTPLDLVMSSALHQTLGPKNEAFKSLAMSATALIEQEAPLITTLRRVCAGLRGEGFEWRREGDEQRLADRIKEEADQVRALEERRLEKDRKKAEERERRRAKEEQERLEQLQAEREEDAERERIAREAAEARRAAEERDRAEAEAAVAATQQARVKEAAQVLADQGPPPESADQQAQEPDAVAQETPATAVVQDAEMTPADQPGDDSTAQPTPVDATAEVMAETPAPQAIEEQPPSQPNDDAMNVDDTPVAQTQNDDANAAPVDGEPPQAQDSAVQEEPAAKDDDTVIEDPVNGEAEGQQGGDVSDSPSEPLRRRSNRVAKRKRSYSHSSSASSSAQGIDTEAGTGTHTPALGEVVAAEEMPEYVSRLVDPEVYVRSLFVSNESVKMPVLGPQAGGEVLSPNEQEVMLHDCLTDLHRFLADTLEYRDRLSEICDGVLGIERRKKGMYKVVRLVAADWLQEESLADEAAQTDV